VGQLTAFVLMLKIDRYLVFTQTHTVNTVDYISLDFNSASSALHWPKQTQKLAFQSLFLFKKQV
jgi:hypothetical protein